MTVDYAPPQPGSTMRRDIVSAYAASGAKIGSWLIAMAMVFRFDPNLFAVFVLIRSTLSLLNYTTLGLAPAIIHRLSAATQQQAAHPSLVVGEGNMLTYADPSLGTIREHPAFRTRQVMFSALLLAVMIASLGAAIATSLSRVEWMGDSSVLWAQYSAQWIVTALGIGMALRLASDVCGAILQSLGRIALDNWLQVTADVIWIAAMAWEAADHRADAVRVSMSFQFACTTLLVMRLVATALVAKLPRPHWAYFSADTVFGLLGFGLLVSLAQLADFLYAPTDYWLIKQLIGLETIATYAPAVQIDGAMLLLVGGLAAVLLPKSAAAHVRGNVDALRVYYVRGTLASLAMLTAAGLVVWLASSWIFRLWLGDPMPATQAILPLVLIHTVVGGSSAVGRSVLLGMGKVWPFTVAALIAGVANVLLSFTFVAVCGWGLKGIVLGTIVAVVGRCAVWQPWYVWRCLRRVGFNPPSDVKAVG